MAGRNGADAVLNADNDGPAAAPEGQHHRWGGMIRLAGAVALLSLLGACSSVPDTLDPTTWYGPSKQEAAKAGEEGKPKNDLQAQRGEEPPGSDQSYPKLSRVDQQAAARDNMQGGLVADSQAPQYADAVPRQGESSPPKEPPTPEPQSSAAPQPAPPAQPALPVTPVPEKTAAASSGSDSSGGSVQSEPLPIAQPKPETEVSGSEMAAAQPSASAASSSSSSTTSSAVASTMPQDDSGGIDQSAMAARLKQRLADIRARSSTQGSLMTSDLQTNSQGGLSTVVVSSNGVQTMGGDQQDLTLPGAEQMPSRSNYVENKGALPLPPNAVHVATIQFARGTARLSSRDRRILVDVKRLQQQRGGQIRIIGHASQWTRNMDVRQHEEVNFKVSKARANRVANELVRLGVPRRDVLIAAVGDTEPRFFEVMPSGEAGNRRTEIYLSQ